MINELLNTKKLDRQFYCRDALIVAKNLLGKIFVYNSPTNLLAAKIVEVEAYKGKTDQAAHSFSGLTQRNEIMFGDGGYLYVYFVYGVHYCCNVVTGKEGSGDACLLRGMEPLQGINIFAQNRFNKLEINTKEKMNQLNGPGKICKSFGIDKQFNGIDLTGNRIYISDSNKINKKDIVISQRIGISKSKELLWRFYIKDNKFVSKK